MPKARADADEAPKATVTSKSAATKATGKKATGKKTAGKKTAAKKTAAKKTAAKKTAAKKTADKKTADKKTAGKKTAAKKTAAKKTVAKKTAAKKTAAKKTAGAKKATSSGTSTAKKSTAKKSTAKRTTGTGKSPAPTSASKKQQPGPRGPHVALPVREGETAWSAAELAEVRGELETDRERLLAEVSSAEHDIQVLLRDGGDGAGNDQADVGSNALERDAEMSLAKNAREMLFQVERALARLDDGTYGVCESCGQPIGKLRLMAFPRATLCVSCKQRQERR